MDFDIKIKKKFIKDLEAFEKSYRRPPYPYEAALLLHVSDNTIHAWRVNYPEFDDIFSDVIRKSKQYVLQGFSDGFYDIEFVKFSFRDIFKDDTISLKDRKTLEIKEKEINNKSDDEVSLKFFED